METIKDVVLRNQFMTEEEFDKKMKEVRDRVESGGDPIEILIDIFGNDVDSMIKVLSPQDT